MFFNDTAFHLNDEIPKRNASSIFTNIHSNGRGADLKQTSDFQDLITLQIVSLLRVAHPFAARHGHLLLERVTLPQPHPTYPSLSVGRRPHDPISMP